MPHEQSQPVVGIIGMGDVRVLPFDFPTWSFKLMGETDVDGTNVCKAFTRGWYQDVRLNNLSIRKHQPAKLPLLTD